jgi:hypothetical protein
MEKEMTDLKVYVSDKGFICMEQSAGGYDDPSAIAIHPDQVDILVQWLQKAKGEALAIEDRQK